MDVGALRGYCLNRPGATAGHPFGPGALVIKVCGKIFAIIDEEVEPTTVSLKCEPEIAPLLRLSYNSVGPGYHLSKRHWNTITLDGEVQTNMIREWVDDSYDLVVDGLSRREREALRNEQRSGRTPPRGPA